MQKLRALVLRFNNAATHAAWEKIMDAYPCEFLATICADRHEYTRPSANHQEWFPSSDIRGGLYAGTQMPNLLPLDEALITGMREAEAVFMHMVTRMEYARVFTYDMRKNMYYTHLRFWNDYLERNRINLLVSGIMPHEIPDYLIYTLCKYKKIPTLMFHATTITDCASLFSDWELSTPEVRVRFEELQREYAGKTIDQISLSERFLEYFNKQTGAQGKTPITFIRPKAWQRLTAFVRGHPLAAFVRFLHWAPSIFAATAWRRRWEKFVGRWRLRSLQMFYDRTAIVPDLFVKYIYVPLHLQPECSTSPLAGAFVDQVMAVQLLAATAPADVLLYVKEHPLQRTRGFACRDRQFYKDILAIPNVRLIRDDVDTFALREHCRAVATATGTPGIEALFRGKPVFMFGHRFYQYAPGVFPIHTKDDAKQAMHAIFVEGVTPDLFQVRLFLKALQETSVHASITDWHQWQASNLSLEDHTKAIADAVITHLPSIIR